MPRVYLVDERITNPQIVLSNIPKHEVGILVTSAMSPLDIVSTVLDSLSETEERLIAQRRAAGVEDPVAGLITGMRILAHGDCYKLLLGDGITDRNAAQLVPLSTYMRTGATGRCELLGCNVAVSVTRIEQHLGGAAMSERFGTPCPGWNFGDFRVRDWSGYRLVRAIARSLGVPTTVGLDSQTSAYDWHFLGPTMTVDPYGDTTFTGMDTPGTYYRLLP